MASADSVDCSEAYGGKPMRCERVTCDAKFSPSSASGRAPFRRTSRTCPKTARPCSGRTTDTTTIHGRRLPQGVRLRRELHHRTDDQRVPGVLRSTGAYRSQLADHGRECRREPVPADRRRAQQVSTFRLDYKNAPASLAIWSLVVPSHDHAPEMEYTTIDGRDLTATGVDRRNVTITLRVGPKATPSARA